MTNLPVMPIGTNVMVLHKPTPIVETFADFTRLPFFDGERCRNPHVPNIREEIDSQSIQSQDSYREPGFHLNLAMPGASAIRRRGSAGKIQFAAALIPLPVISR